jgi:hypothetical protein
VTFTAATTVSAGSFIELVNPATVDTTIANVAVTLIGNATVVTGAMS